MSDPGTLDATSGAPSGALPAHAPRPIDPAEGPWLIRSHYWNAWHRRSADGAASGYTDDIARAGVFGEAKAREYNDWPRGRDEAVPVSREADKLRRHLRQMDAERAALAATMDWLAGGASSGRDPIATPDGATAPGAPE